MYDSGKITDRQLQKLIGHRTKVTLHRTKMHDEKKSKRNPESAA